jgi:hypothetical protein
MEDMESMEETSSGRGVRFLYRASWFFTMKDMKRASIPGLDLPALFSIGGLTIGAAVRM